MVIPTFIKFRHYFCKQFTINSKETYMEMTSRGKSLINIKNNIGPSTDPCGTPLVTANGCDAIPQITNL